LAGIVLLLGPLFQDHFYATFPNPKAVDSPTPAQVVEKYKEIHPAQPMIVVTASGGGIHSAAWTARVLEGLERAFAAKGFHQHVVLMSSVSGGSVAASYWADLYLDQPAHFAPPAEFASRVSATECSSLEAAAWGLLYPDLNLLDWKGIFLRPAALYDRGWALETAFARNLGHGCEWFQGAEWRDGLPAEFSRYRLTTLRDATRKGEAPAFAFNTTLVKGGLRFLLSSYRLPEIPPPAYAILGSGDTARPAAPLPTQDLLSSCPDLDLSLFTVARLSATFPFVTPVAVAHAPQGEHAAPSDKDQFCYTEHLADGGYYDNDGMASAMEFLWSVYDSDQHRQEQQAAPPSRQPQQESAGTAGQEGKDRDQIFLIEIRNSPEPQAPPTPQRPLLGHLVEQVTSPITTLLGAWDVAQSTRNQREYRLLESALRDNVSFHHVIFEFQTEPGEQDPLSWHLTARDKERIESEWKELYETSARDLAATFPASSGK
jgi:hypothetical protein